MESTGNISSLHPLSAMIRSVDSLLINIVTHSSSPSITPFLRSKISPSSNPVQFHTFQPSPPAFPPRFCRLTVSSSPIPAAPKSVMATDSVTSSSMKLLFVEMGVGYDQHGQDITSAAMRACRDAISSNSIPAFRRGSIPGVTFNEMKLQIKLGVPQPLQSSLDIEKVKSVFPYGRILNVEVVDGGLICSSGVHVEEMGDKNDDCYIVNAAVYVGY